MLLRHDVVHHGVRRLIGRHVVTGHLEAGIQQDIDHRRIAALQQGLHEAGERQLRTLRLRRLGLGIHRDMVCECRIHRHGRQVLRMAGAAAALFEEAAAALL